MKPLVQASLVNGRTGDPGLYLDFLFENRALLFDLGDISALAPRKLLRISHAFVSHAHMDHFVGFDRLLRVCLGREKQLALVGPAGFVARLEHKLAAYSWNLVKNFPNDFAILAAEWDAGGHAASTLFRCRTGFAREEAGAKAVVHGVLLEEAAFRVRAAVLDHDIPCLAFAFEEKRHVNVLKARLAEMGLRVGPWLRAAKAAALADAPDDTRILARWREDGGMAEREVALGELREKALRFAPGQKIAYVTDVAFTAENTRRIAELARGADTLFIESPFLEADAAIAARKYHLTAFQAGRLARMAGARSLVVFHFSPRYAGREEELIREAEAAFAA